MSKIVDVLTADWEKQKNYRYGRDYYTRQAGLPSGRKNNQENFWKFRDEDSNPTSPINEFDFVTHQITSRNYDDILNPEENDFGSSYEEENSRTYSDGENEIVVKVNTGGLLYNPEDTYDVGEKDIYIKVNTDGLLYIPEDNDCNSPHIQIQSKEKEDSEIKPRDRKYESNPSIDGKEISVKVNTDNLLYNPPQLQHPDETNKKSIPTIVKNELSNSKIEKKEFYIKVNTEDLLYYPEDNEYDDPKIIPSKKEVNSNSKDVYQNNQNEIKKENEGIEPQNIPKIVPRSFIHQNKPKVIQRENKVTKFSNEDNTHNNENLSVDTNNAPTIVVNKRSDNTLIKKIYSDPVVRSFALTNRQHIPVTLDSSFKLPENSKIAAKPNDLPKVEVFDDKLFTNLDDNYQNETISNEPIGDVEASEESDVDIDNNSTSISDFSDNYTIERPTSLYREDNLDDLKEKRLVASRLGEFSKSFPNLSKINFTNENFNTDTKAYKNPKNQSNGNFQNELRTGYFVSVKNLKKLFENN